MPQPGVTSAKGLGSGPGKPPQKSAEWSKAHKMVANANSPLAAELFIQMNRCRTDPAGYAEELRSDQAKEALSVVESVPPLEAISTGMTKACLDHVLDLKKVDLAATQDVHTGRDGSTLLERLERYGDCVGDITGELVLVKPAKKAQRPDKSDAAADARAVMTQITEDPTKLTLLMRREWRHVGIGSGVYGKGGRTVVIAFTTEYDANPYASWVDTNVKMRVFGSGLCICFVTPDPIDIKITIPLCTIM